MKEPPSASDIATLVISEHTNPDKIERHIGPLSDVTEHTTMVCLTPNPKVDVNYIKVPSYGSRIIGILLMFFIAISESLKNEYDVVVSFSLYPYGLYALLVGRISQKPTHLGILGADLDRHSHTWYRWGTQAAFRQFDSISVLGTRHRQQLIEYGVNAEVIFILTNAIDPTIYNPEANSEETIYDFVWSGRLAPEKNPLLFIKSISELRKRGYEVGAVLLGSGKLEHKLTKVIDRQNLTDVVDFPGWVDEPAEYYAKSRIFVLTSKREALGLSLIESMAMGLACIAPPVGNIPDIIHHEHNALLVEDHDSETFADAMERILTNEDLRERLGENAIPVGQSHSYESAREDWREILSQTVF